MKLRFDDNRKNILPAETKILDWSRAAKGIDDALLIGEKLKELTIADWFSALNERSREEVKNVWETGDK